MVHKQGFDLVEPARRAPRFIRFGGLRNRRTLFTALATAGILVVAMVGSALAGESAASAVPDPALVDAIVRNLESSGRLDRAVERALSRVIQRQEDASRATEAQRQAQARERARMARKVASGRDHIRGNQKAEISLIEYSDFECPYCKRFHGTLASLLERHGGRVNWVYRHYPLAFHEPAARREAIASECAAKLGGNEAFWKYADALFANTRSNGQGLPEEKSEQAIAAQQGLDAGAFARCMRDPKVATRVDEDLADGAAVGISGTPTTLIRNNRSGATEVMVGAQPLEALDAAIGRVLGAKP